MSDGWYHRSSAARLVRLGRGRVGLRVKYLETQSDIRNCLDEVMPHSRALIPLATLAALPIFYIGGGWVSDDFVHFTQPTTTSPLDAFQRADPFGFYRPIPQLSFAIEGMVFGPVPAAYRATNVILHVTAVLLVYLASCRLLTRRGATLATLAFVSTPKATTAAVLWISARPELLMSVIALVAAWSWLRWQEHRRHGWLALCATGYVLAFLSKESAVLLPFALAAMRARQSIVPISHRIAAASAVAALAIAPLVMRMFAGALMPGESHDHYALDFSAYRIFRSLAVYIPRALPAMVGLIVVAGVVAVLTRRVLAWRELWQRDISRVSVAAAAWFLAFLAPVAPILARHELYLYLPVFGLCLFAAALADEMLPVPAGRAAQIALGVYVIGFAAYQHARHMEAYVVQQFTKSLVDAISTDARLRTSRGTIAFVAEDARSEELMRKGVGGYINGVTEVALPKRTFAAHVAHHDATSNEHERVTYRFVDGRVQLSH